MLTGREELERLRAGVGALPSLAPGFVEGLVVVAADPGEVLERARTVLESVIHGGEEGLDPENPAWSQLLPGWFIVACSAAQTAYERERWLAHWRGLDRAGKSQAEADLGWTLVDWLAAVELQVRSWRWWAYDSTTAWVLVDGWPAPLEALEWLLKAAGARSVEPTPSV